MFFKGPVYKDIELPHNIDKEIAKRAIRLERLVFVVKGVISFISVIAGIWFTKVGVETDATIKFSFKELTFEMSKAYPGIVFLVFGITLMLFSRLKIKFK